MMDYKKTLNLPTTDFPMKANLPQLELTILKKWQDLKLYPQLSKKNKGKKKFVLHFGPPYANGHIHLGHATNGILKDFIIKSKMLQGFDAPMVPGWDCHGLPIELNVEKKFGKPGIKITPKAFREACRAYAEQFIDIQREEFKRLGLVADWENAYYTMDYQYEANIIRSLAQVFKNDHLQKGFKPVHWCLDCASALAEAEVEYIDKSSPSIDVRFKVIDIEDFYARFDGIKKNENDVIIPIWTTTPWTLPANEGVSLNPDLFYVLIDVGDEIFLIAEDLKDQILERYDISNSKCIAKIQGKKLEGIKLQHPFYHKTVPVLLGEHVTADSGTGAVHTAPVHGPDDFNIGKKYGLAIVNPVGNNGCFTDQTPLFAGLHVKKADPKIIAVLKEKGTLIKETQIQHSYPHCWRHKTPIIFRATPQWFISMEKQNLRNLTLETIPEVKWIPEKGEARIRTMIEGRPDWCISRQRTWGVPIPFFLHEDTGEIHPKTLELLEKVAELVEKSGIEAWYEISPNQLLGSDSNKYQPLNDVLDVWFDSGVSHYCVLGMRPELHFPSDLVLEGSDQHRGWFQTSLLSSMAMNGVAPYREVLTHGFVLDGQGRKMSKSLGNVISPQEIMQNLGADILRLWVGSVDYRNDINASTEVFNRMTEAYRRIRNTTRFLLANLHDFDPLKNAIDSHTLLPLDQWIIARANLIQSEIINAYEIYQFHVIIQKIQQFCIADLGSFYLDIIKDRQYTMAKESVGKRSAQTALYLIIEAMVRWMAPILSFTAEEIWSYMPGERSKSVFFDLWYDKLFPLSDEQKFNPVFWDRIRLIKDGINKEIENKRNRGELGSGLEAQVNLYCDQQTMALLNQLGEELRFVFIVSEVNVHPMNDAPKDAVLTEINALSILIKKTDNEKCDRCWHRRPDVDKDKSYPGICGRCIVNITKPEGEKRLYV